MKFYWMAEGIRKFRRRIPGDLENVIGAGRIREAFDGVTIRSRVYPMWKLFQIFLHQVASGISCSEAIAWGIGQQILPTTASPKTSAYCNAKSRMPEAPIFDLMKAVGAEVEGHAHKSWRMFGRNVKVVDGTSVQLPDTDANQREYPQPPGQRKGCGQPHMKLCALMGLGTGAILDCVVGSFTTSERTMFRELWRTLVEGDIVLGDRGFGSYAEVAMLMRKKVDFVFRQRRKSLKTRMLRKIGKDEWIVTWRRPWKCGDWVGRDELPEMVEVRAIRFIIEIKGHRSREVILFTSLVDPKKYPLGKLKELYYRRWEMELMIRDVKTTMKLELLRSKTPGGCRKELWMGLIACNLVRGVMLDAALRARLRVSSISFTGTLRCLDSFSTSPAASGRPETAYTDFLDLLAKRPVPHRPGRVEPRKTKRRPKNSYPFLTKPRSAARIEALNA